MRKKREYQLTSNEFVSHHLEKQGVVLHENVVFLRPHHFRVWKNITEFINPENGKLNKEKFIQEEASGMLIRALRELSEIMGNSRYSKRISRDVEILGIIKDPRSEKLTDEERDKLKSRYYSLKEEDFLDTAKKLANIYEKILSKPKTTSIVIARTLDFQCKLLSKDGCGHCDESDNHKTIGEDDFYLTAIEYAYLTKIFDDEITNQIKIVYFNNSTSVQSVVIPLSLMLNDEFLSEIDALAKGSGFKEGELTESVEIYPFYQTFLYNLYVNLKVKYFNNV